MFKNRVWSFLSILLIVAFAAHSATAQLSEVHYRTYSEKDGLDAGKRFGNLFQDSRGFLWIATLNGLYRFDGSQFKSFRHDEKKPSSISHNQVWHVTETPDSRLWVSCADGGLAVFNPWEGKFTKVPLTLSDSFPNQITKMVTDSKGNIWLLRFGHGLLKYIPSTGKCRAFLFTGKDFRQVWLLENVLNDVILEDDSLLWLATNRGLVLFNTRTEHHVLYLDSLCADPDKSNTFTALYREPDGNLWAATWGRGLKYFDRSTGTFTTFYFHPDSTSGANNIVNGIARKNEDELWLSTLNRGIMLFNKVNKTFTALDDPDRTQLAFMDNGHGMFQDRNSIIWHTGQYGLTKIDPAENSFSFHPVTEDNKRLFCSSILWGTEGQCWIGVQERGLVCVNKDGSRKEYKWKGFRYNSWIFDIKFDEKGRLWMNTTEGFKIFDPVAETFSGFPTGIKNGRAFENAAHFVTDGSGKVWGVSFGKGIQCYDPLKREVFEYNTHHTGKQHIFTDFWYSCFRDSNGNVWMGSSQGGFIVYDWRKDELKTWKHNPKDTRSFPHTPVHEITEDKLGNVYMATYHGLLILPRDHPGKKGFKTLTQADGLKMNTILDAASDAEGRIWLLYRRGIGVYDPGKGRFTYIDPSQGLPENLDSHSMRPDPEGNISLLSWNGYYTLSLQRATAPPSSIYFTGYRKLDKGFALLEKNEGNAFEVNWDENMLTIDFRAVNHSLPEQTTYSYQLEGFDPGWFTTPNNFVTYTNLEGGSYVFKVRAINADGIAGPVATLNFQVHPPFWKTFWFRLSVVVLIAALVGLIYRNRVRSIRKKANFEKRLAELEMTALRAQMNPHFIFNCLNSINRLVIDDDKEAVMAYISRFAKLIRLVLENSRKQEITLKQEIELLRLYLELEKLRFKEKLSYEIEVDERLDLENIGLPPLVIQPYVENSIWHGLMNKEAGGKLQIGFKQEQEQFLCIVEDNGIGREQARLLKSRSAVRQKSYGMQVTSERINGYNRSHGKAAHLQVVDLVDPGGEPAGTRVEIGFPLKKN